MLELSVGTDGWKRACRVGLHRRAMVPRWLHAVMEMGWVDQLSGIIRHHPLSMDWGVRTGLL